MGEEMRAFYNLRWYRATGDAPNSLIGLNGYGPNMNIARDPRYGRTRQACQCPFFCHSLLTSLDAKAPDAECGQRGAWGGPVPDRHLRSPNGPWWAGRSPNALTRTFAFVAIVTDSPATVAVRAGSRTQCGHAMAFRPSPTPRRCLFGSRARACAHARTRTGTHAALQCAKPVQGMDEYESGASKWLKMTLGLKHYDLWPPPSIHPR